MNRHQNVTFINDLPDLEQLEYQEDRPQNQFNSDNSFNHPNYNKAYGGQDTNREDPDKYKKYIRNNSYNLPKDAGMGYNNNTQYNPSQNLEKNIEQIYEPIISNYNIPNCIQISEHIRDCPICTRFYKNDNTIHIIIIIILSIMCLLLLKRVLDI